MSEHKKRLTEQQVVEGLGAIALTGDSAVALAELRADHLQAREDVRRLAERLRARVTACEIDCSPESYAPEVPIYEMCGCGRCVADRRLILEMES